MRALAVLLALPAACQNQPPQAANAAPPAKAAQAWTPPRSDLEVAEELVRRSLDNAPGISFANARVYRGERIPIVCGEVIQAGQRSRYIAIGGRAAWLEAKGDLPPAQMDAAVRQYCTGEGRPS